MLALLLVPVVAHGQSAPPPSPAPSSSLPAHPALPWSLGVAIPTGQLLRTLWVPPQTVVVDTLVPAPEEPRNTEALVAGTEQRPAADAPPAAEMEPRYMVWRQTAVVPGYWVRQTTAGDYYPERWMLEQTASGAYRWRLLPAELRAR